MYHVDCECGARIEVTLVQAGLDLLCPNCGKNVSVPNTVKLRELSGDTHGNLTPLQRADLALRDGAPPFDGRCQRCHKHQADVEVPVSFEFLEERFLENDGGLTISGQFKVSGGTEQWVCFEFPLLFCEQCHSKFRVERRRARWSGLFRSLRSTILLGPLVLLLLLFSVFVPHLSVPAMALILLMTFRFRSLGSATWLRPLALLLLLLSLFVPLLPPLVTMALILLMAFRFRRRKNVDPFVLSVLETLPFVGEAVQEEDEYRVRLLRARPRASTDQAET